MDSVLRSFHVSAAGRDPRLFSVSAATRAAVSGPNSVFISSVVRSVSSTVSWRMAAAIMKLSDDVMASGAVPRCSAITWVIIAAASSGCRIYGTAVPLRTAPLWAYVAVQIARSMTDSFSDCTCLINASISSLVRFIAGILCSFIVYVLYCRKAAAGTAAAMCFCGKAAPGAACQAPGACGAYYYLFTH